MLSEPKKTEKEKSELNGADKVKDYGNDPYFVKKANESKKFLEEHGFPKELLIKK